jgi:hypothetical protein
MIMDLTTKKKKKKDLVYNLMHNFISLNIIFKWAYNIKEDNKNHKEIIAYNIMTKTILSLTSSLLRLLVIRLIKEVS